MKRSGLTHVAVIPVTIACLLAACLAATVVLSSWIAVGDRGGPQIVLTVCRRDLGTVKRGSTVQATFPIANSGERRLVLVEHVEACCGQSAEPRRIILAPGESTDLSLELDTNRWAGRARETVRYTTNDPKMPQFALEVTANVNPE
jgi:hypothetical protein